MNVFRLHIRPTGGLNNAAASFTFCLKEGLLGLGWQTYSDKTISGWDDYFEEAKKHHPRLSSPIYLKNRVKIGDLIWTRSVSGEYYLCQVVSEWEYLNTQEAKDADIVNVVRCKILRVPRIDEVPGKVVACFRPTRTIQSIADESAVRYSGHLWNRLSGAVFYTAANSGDVSIFSLLGSEETEDVIFIYLQTRNWLVIPHSRKADTMSFEFYLIHRDTKERAIVQIKTGNTQLVTSEWSQRGEKVYLFQSNGYYQGEAYPNVECIAPEAVESFMESNRDILPKNILFWLDYKTANTVVVPEPKQESQVA